MSKRQLLQLLTIVRVADLSDDRVDEMLVDFLTGRRFPAESPFWRN